MVVEGAEHTYRALDASVRSLEVLLRVLGSHSSARAGGRIGSALSEGRQSLPLVRGRPEEKP